MTEKEKEAALEDDFTGKAAQEDPEFYADDNVFSIDNAFDDIQSVDLTEFDSKFSDLSFDKYVVLPKKQILTFLRLVEPWTKISIDTYGKSLRIRSISSDAVELKYENKPTSIGIICNNSSGKEIDTFFLRIEVLKRVAAQASNLVCFAVTECGLCLPLGNQVVPLETLRLQNEVYESQSSHEISSEGDIDAAIFSELIKSFNVIAPFSERAQDKVIKLYRSHAKIVSPSITLTSTSPLKLCLVDLELSKSFVDSLTVFQGGQVGLVYQLSFQDDALFMTVRLGHSLFITTRVSKLEFEEYKQDPTDQIFSADWTTVQQLCKMLTGFDYYNPVVGLSLLDGVLKAETKTKDLTKTHVLDFPTSGAQKNSRELKFNSKILNSVLSQDIIVEKSRFTDNTLVFVTKSSTYEINSNF